MSLSRCLPVVLLLAAVFAGCLGEDSSDVEAAAAAERAAAEQAALDAAANATVDDGTQEANLSMGEQPHIHDYWQGAERVTLMDADVQMDPFRTMAFTFFDIAQGTPGVGGAFLELPDGAIVYEGTGQLEFTVSWNDPTITGMGVQYRSASGDAFSEVQAITAGTPLVIEVTPEMTDMPHAKTSRWMFILSPSQTGQIIAGNMHVKVDIVKTRDLTKFPGHPDHFNGASTLLLFKGAGKSAQTSFVRDITNFATNAEQDDSIISDKVVPMRTLSMTANLTVTGTSATVGGVADLWLEVRPADTFRYYRTQVLASDETAGTYQFAWPVEMQETDSPYAKVSAWHFRVRATSDPTGQGENGVRGVSDIQVDFDLEVVAYDALLDGIEPRQENNRGGP